MSCVHMGIDTTALRITPTQKIKIRFVLNMDTDTSFTDRYPDFQLVFFCPRLYSVLVPIIEQ